MCIRDRAASGKVLIRKLVWGLSKDDCNDLTVTLKLVELDEKIHQKIGDAIKEVDVDPDLIGDLPEPRDDVFEVDEVDDPMETESIEGRCGRLYARSLRSIPDSKLEPTPWR